MGHLNRVQCLAVVLVMISFPLNSQGALSSSEEQEVLKRHNDLRRQTAKGLTKDKNGAAQPKAADMMEMVWDNELAAAAQTYADSCPGIEHSKDRKGVGENMVEATVGSMSVSEMIGGWFSEITNVPGVLSCPVSSFSRACLSAGHYTQVMVNDQHFGQRFIFPTFSSLDSSFSCGNVLLTAPIYTEGEPCSKCDSAQTCNDALCSGAADLPYDCAKGDTSSGCSSWFGQGKCTEELYKKFMQETCPTTCGYCSAAEKLVWRSALWRMIRPGNAWSSTS